VAPDELEGTEEDLDFLIDEWTKMAENNPALVYQAKPRPKYQRSEPRPQNAALLRSHSDEDLTDAFPTLWSLRNVDVESDLYLES
jgi:hypothetical protein